MVFATLTCRNSFARSTLRRHLASCTIYMHKESFQRIASSLSTSTTISRSVSSFSSSPIHNDTITASSKPHLSLDDPYCNIPKNISDRLGRNLHRRLNHPLNTIQAKIVEYWNDRCEKEGQHPPFVLLDDLSPIVSTQQNFDVLNIPPDHISRQPSDTYYINRETVLRTHTSAHQVDLLKQGLDRFLVSGDVVRRDEIDRSHYPIFHQMEGVQIFDSPQNSPELMERDLKQGLEGLAAHLFGPETPMRWVDAYFPFTHPSFELEIYFEDREWLEVLGCGLIHPEIMKHAGRPDERGWAFGLGLERLAMVLFQIPDIRLFWTEDERFHSQFQSGAIVQFQPYSKYPFCYKDISFWLPEEQAETTPSFHVNDLNELVRNVAGDLVEEVVLLDQFVHPKTNRSSHCYRISYRSMDRNLTNEEIDTLQQEVRNLVVKDLGVELR